MSDQRTDQTIPLAPPPPPPSAAPRTTPGAVPRPQGDATGGVIPYKNPAALVGYYLTVASLIPGLGALTGVVAFCLGIAGLRARRKQPHIKGAVHAWIAIIGGGLLGLLWITVIVAGAVFA